MFAPWVNPKESRLIRWRTSQGNLGKYQPMICRLQTPKCTTQSVTNSFETDSNWNGQHSNCTWWLRVLEPPTCVSGCTKMVSAATVISMANMLTVYAPSLSITRVYSDLWPFEKDEARIQAPTRRVSPLRRIEILLFWWRYPRKRWSVR